MGMWEDSWETSPNCLISSESSFPASQYFSGGRTLIQDPSVEVEQLITAAGYCYMVYSIFRKCYYS